MVCVVLALGPCVGSHGRAILQTPERQRMLGITMKFLLPTKEGQKTSCGGVRRGGGGKEEVPPPSPCGWVTASRFKFPASTLHSTLTKGSTVNSQGGW